MRVPPILKTREEIHEKVELLETLTDVKTAVELMKREPSERDMHPVDRHYLSLKVKLELVGPREFQMINKYLAMTHAPTHNQYKMTIEAAFRITRAEDVKRYVCMRSHESQKCEGQRVSTNTAK